MSERKQNQFGFYYDDCDCLECQYVRGRINIAAEEPRFFGYTLAEVTDMARDHATVHYALQCLAKDYDLAPKAESKNDAPPLPWTVAIAGHWHLTDAPYSFWLGREGCA